MDQCGLDFVYVLDVSSEPGAQNGRIRLQKKLAMCCHILGWKILAKRK